MYKITTHSRKAEKQFYEVLHSRSGIAEKLNELRQDPRKALQAHKLKGRWEGLWSCYLGWDIRLMYDIDDEKREIIILKAGSHKIY